MCAECAVTIRPMRIEDIQTVHAIDVLSFTLPWPERSYHYELVENPGSRLFVAEAEPASCADQPETTMGENDLPEASQPEASQPGKREVIGMVVSWLIVDEAHIATIAVHPEWRGLGIGKRLLAAALADAFRQGMTNAILEVRSGNTLARSIYTEFGFITAGCRKGYYQDNHEDAILMSLANLNQEYVHQLEMRYPRNGGPE